LRSLKEFPHRGLGGKPPATATVRFQSHALDAVQTPSPYAAIARHGIPEIPDQIGHPRERDALSYFGRTRHVSSCLSPTTNTATIAGLLTLGQSAERPAKRDFPAIFAGSPSSLAWPHQSAESAQLHAAMGSAA
jgi:hypothetical protein